MPFDNKLLEMYKLYVEQNGSIAEFQSLDDDGIMKMILTVEAIIYINTKNNFVAVSKRS